MHAQNVPGTETTPEARSMNRGGDIASCLVSPESVRRR